jgi:hypothetical protein
MRADLRPGARDPALRRLPTFGLARLLAAIATSRQALAMRALLLSIASSFVALSTFVWRHGAWPTGGWTTGSTDHLSHVGSVILLWHRGLSVWRKPLAELCPVVAREGVYFAFPWHDVCSLPERAGLAPIVTNWRQFPRPYPPGWALWHAPGAILHETTSIGLHALARLLVIQDLLAAHVAIALLAVLLFSPIEPLAHDGHQRARAHDAGTFALRIVVFLLASGELIRWSMLGYYDGAAIACALVALLRLRDARHDSALLWLAGSLFLHYRALWLAPIFVFVAAEIVRQRRLATPRVAAASLLVVLSLGAFALVWPALRRFPVTNPIAWLHFDRGNAEHWDLVIPLAAAAAILVRARALLVLATVGFQLFVLTRTRQVQSWHALSFLPIVGLARIAPGRRGGAELACATILVVEYRQVFRDVPLPGDWLATIFRAH